MYALTIFGYEVFYSSELAEKSSKLAENRQHPLATDLETRQKSLMISTRWIRVLTPSESPVKLMSTNFWCSLILLTLFLTVGDP